MKSDQLVTHELTKRLNRVRRRISALSAEAEMIERMLIDAEKFATVPRLKLRKNSAAKWNARSRIRAFLAEQTQPVRSKAIYEALHRYDPTLKPSTFRSHLKRMVDEGIIVQDGPRGHHRLLVKPEREPTRSAPLRRRRVTIGEYI